MGQYVSQIILGLSSLIVGSLGAYALLVRAKASASEARQLLIRLWDWIEQAGHAGLVPPHLKRAILTEITRQENIDEPVA